MYRNLLTTIILAALLPLTATAEDVKGSKDHPLLTRFPESHITEYANNYNEAEFIMSRNEAGEEVKEAMEGNVTNILYFYDKPDNQPSPLQVIRNYQNAIKAIGGEIVYERKPKDGDSGDTTLKAIVKNKEYWVRVRPEIFSSPTQSYRLIILEKAEMVQAVVANTMLDEFNEKGFVTLYINFDTNKWDIKPDAIPTIIEAAKVLQSSPEVKVSVEGHTDDVGTAESNKTLSENRAKSVMAALVAQGVDATRLSAVGYGSEKSIADNRSEEGKAKNRRVELVKR